MLGQNRRQPTPRTSTAFLLAATLVGAAIVTPLMGKLGLLVGSLAGLCVAIIVDASVRASKSPHLKDGRPVDLAGLDAQQQLVMLGQGLTAGGDFRSELLRELDAARELADRDLEAGWRRSRELCEAHPRSAAAWALRGQLAGRGERPDEALEATSRAFELAAQGGLNQLLAEYYDDASPELRDGLELSRSAWQQLGRALRARGRAQEADAADERADAVDPHEDAERRRRALHAAAEALRADGEREAADITDLLAAARDPR